MYCPVCGGEGHAVSNATNPPLLDCVLHLRERIDRLERGGKRRKKAGTALTRAWCDTYRERQGSEYYFQARDGAILADLARSHGEETVLRCIDAFHRLPEDEYLRDRGYDVPSFRAKFQGLLWATKRGTVDHERAERAEARRKYVWELERHS